MASGDHPLLTLYGRHPVREALQADPRRVEALFLERDAGERSAQIVALARAGGVRYVHVDRAVLTQMVGTPHHQGVVARLAARTYASLDELLAVPRVRGEPALFLALDQVQDPGNVGSLLRTAEALGVHGAVLPRHHAAGLTAHAAKAAAGALEYLPVARVGNLGQTLDVLRREGCRVVGASASAAGARPPWAVDLRGPVAVVLGSEERGLRPLVARGCDELTRIPLVGRVGSLNVAAAGAGLLYEVLRQRREAPGEAGRWGGAPAQGSRHEK